ncbi:MAG: hypothetical protein V1833_02610 [Elusimicrobiota bacterium]
MNIKKIIVNLRRPLIVLLHLCLIIIAYISAFYLRFEFTFFPENWQVILRTLPFLIIIKLLFFYFFGLFTGLWRYVSIGDLWDIILANFLANVVFAATVFFYHTFFGFPRSVFIIDFILCTVFVSGVRFFTRLIRERFKESLTTKKKECSDCRCGSGGNSGFEGVSE